MRMTQELEMNQFVEGQLQDTLTLSVIKEKHKDEPNPIKNSKIKWDKYNFPEYFKLVHYDLNEIDSRIRPVFKSIHTNLYSIILIFFIKIVIHFFLIESDNTTRVFIFIIGFVLFVFKYLSSYIAYRSFFYDDSLFKIYWASAWLFIIFFSLNLSLSTFLFDGFGMFDTEFNDTTKEKIYNLVSVYIYYYMQSSPYDHETNSMKSTYSV